MTAEPDMRLQKAVAVLLRDGVAIDSGSGVRAARRMRSSARGSRIRISAA